jgi:hypothetical protein
MTKLKKCLFAGLLAVLIPLGLLGYSGEVGADAFLDFNLDATHPAGASISYAGGNNPLIGSNLSVDTVTGIGTPNNPGTMLTIVGGTLTFTTGNLTGSSIDTWYFGGGGSITLTGGIDLDPLTPGLEIPVGTVLLSGTFTDASVMSFGRLFKISGASFFDTKNGALTTYFGLPSGTYEGNFNISFLASGFPPNFFSSTSVGSGDVLDSPVPEPATMLLFGGGLVGIGILARRKFHRT